MFTQLAVLLIASTVSLSTVTTSQAILDPSTLIARANSSAIKKGMTYESVVSELGEPSHCQENVQVVQGDKIRSRTCTWYLNNGQSIIILFRDVYAWGGYKLEVVGTY